MSYTPIVPAELALDGNGIPYAPAYADSYHTAAGGLEQARHVFLEGNDLPQRWQDRRFVILETGFGLGLNFLCAWQAWKANPGEHLHYVAIEKHPFRLADLQRLHAQWPELTPFASRLQAQWPLPLPGLHRLDLGDVVLTLGFGDAAELLPQLSLSCDAFFLDGFAPSRNPEMWSEAVVAELRRLAAPGATLATWTIAGDLRRRLTSADFSLERRPGFGFKREMLVGRLQGAVSPTPTFSRKKIAVIGAGIAGASIAQALARRGHEVVVVDSAAAPASGASGNLAGVFRPLPARDDSRLARLLRAGFLLGRRQYADLEGLRCGWTGVLHIARDAPHARTQQAIAAEHALPPEFCRFVGREEASELAGWPVEQGGWWFPAGGWLNPPSTCRALLSGIDCRFNSSVERLERAANGWRIVGAQAVVEVAEVVLANGIGAPALAPDFKLPIRAGRGLVSHIPEAATPRFDIVATRLGYVTPAVDGLRCAGATMSLVDAAAALDLAPHLSDHLENLYRLDMVLPGYGTGLDPARLAGRVSFRPMSPDRLPIVGPLSASEGLWIIDGFGARGLVFAPICAELLASQIGGEPLPLEADLVAALAPARFRKKR
jgi:tRNA 5-methylaminomethyl-2-thiouridine biosynthesis bifunctional protein